MNIKKLKVLLFLFTVSVYPAEGDKSKDVKSVREVFKCRWVIVPGTEVNRGDSVINAMDNGRIHIVPHDNGELVQSDVTLRTVETFQKGRDGRMEVDDIKEVRLPSNLVDTHRYLSLMKAVRSFIEKASRNGHGDEFNRQLGELGEELKKLEDIK